MQNDKCKKIIQLMAILAIIWPGLVWSEALIRVNKDNETITLTWLCPIGSTFNLASEDKLHEKKGACQGPTEPNFESYSYSFTPEPIKFTLELVTGGAKKIDTVTVNFGNESAGEPPLTREGGGTTASGEIQVTSPDFGGPFTNIGQYVVAVVKKILPLILAGAVLVIVFAGFRLITSQGSPDSTAQAKSLIEGAVLGIITLFLIGLLLASIVDFNSAKRESPQPDPAGGTSRSN